MVSCALTLVMLWWNDGEGLCFHCRHFRIRNKVSHHCRAALWFMAKKHFPTGLQQNMSTPLHLPLQWVAPASTCAAGAHSVLQVHTVCCRCTRCAAGEHGVLQVHTVCCRWTRCAAGAHSVLQVHIVCCICTWCATDAHGVLQMHTVCCRCTRCAADAHGVLQMHTVCYMCTRCATSAHDVLQVHVVCFRCTQGRRLGRSTLKPTKVTSFTMILYNSEKKSFAIQCRFVVHCLVTAVL